MFKSDNKIFVNIVVNIAIVLLFTAIWAIGSTIIDLKKDNIEADKQKALNNPEVLFTYGKDCTMYRFYDEKSYHYFSVCESTAQFNTHEQPVK